MKTTQYKLYLGFGIITLLLIIVGGIAFWANNQILIELEHKNEDFRFMLDVADTANAISRYAKSAESHLMLYLNLNEKNARIEYSDNITTLENQISILLTGKYDPEGQRIANAIADEKDKILSNGNLLLALHDQIEAPQDSFFIDNQQIILAFHNATSNLRRLGVEFVIHSTNFLNKQMAITTATEISSYATRAAGHLMLFLNFHDDVDREKFFLRSKLLEDQINILEKSFVDPEGHAILEDMRIKKDGLLANGINVLSLYKQDMERTGSFLPSQHPYAVFSIHYIAANLQTLGGQAEKYIIDSEINDSQSTLQSAQYFQFIIIVILICSLVISLIVWYWISRKIPEICKKTQMDELTS